MASKKKRRKEAPTLGELQELLERQTRTIASIEETLGLLVRNLCRDAKINMAMAQLREAKVIK